MDYAPLNECFRTPRRGRRRSPPAWRSCAIPAPTGVARPRGAHRGARAEELRVQRPGRRAQPALRLHAVVPTPTRRRSGSATRSSTCRPPPGPAPSSPTPGWSTPDGRRISTLDVIGRGRFTLVTGLAGRAWVAAVRKLDLPFLDAVVIGAEGAEDPYRGWDRLREIHEAGAVLVRPDGFVAWRHVEAQWDDDNAQGAIEHALGQVLARAAGSS